MSRQRVNLLDIDHQAFSKLDNRSKILHVLRLAVLAPSTHNTQPWMFEISGGNRCRLLLDPERSLPMADSELKYSYISLGALLTNLHYAGKYYGLVKSIKVQTGSGNQVALILFDNETLRPDNTLRPYIRAMIDRQNFRGQFDDRPVSITELSDMLDLSDKNDHNIGVFSSQQSETTAEIARLTAQGLQKAYSNRQFRVEVAKHLNFNKSKKTRGMHGYTLRMNNIQSLFLPWLLKIKDLGPKLARLNESSIRSSKAVVVLATKANNAQSWVRTGQTLERLLLRAAQQDIRTSIFVASLELSDSREQIKKRLGINTSYTPHVLFVLGRSSERISYSHRERPEKLARFL
ncbi:MAG TPA: hypothetical protein VGA08_00190 [Candidatus Saccharimonadales bacterium]